MLRRLALAAAFLAAPALLPAQSSIVGKWKIEFVAGMRMDNDGPTMIKANATLTVTEQGDSLIATLDVEPNAEVQARPQARLAGPKATGANATLLQRSSVTINNNGEEMTRVSISTWSLTVNGNALTGSVQRAIEGSPMQMPATPVSGTRM